MADTREQESRVSTEAADPAAIVTAGAMSDTHALSSRIRTPDQRVRVFVSSTLQELAPERAIAREAIARLRLTPVLFELGARPHPPRDLYRAYLAQSDVFLGIYWQRYGWVAPGMDVSGLEDEYHLAADKPKLMYVKAPAPQRESGLQTLLDQIRTVSSASYKSFETADELRDLIENDLALLLAERFEREQAFEPEQVVRAPIPPQRPRRYPPVPRSPLIDRTHEVATACAELRAGVSPVTLTGPGGSGKTRVALQVAANLLDDFSDGVVFVPLADIRDPDLVARSMASVLEARESSGLPVIESLKSALSDRHLLLVLDNFEQVMVAAALVVDLLESCPRLAVLVTSRQPLHVRGEKELLVPPLAVPDSTNALSVQRIAQYPGVELFVQRTRDVRPHFALNTTTAPVVVAICQRLDGLPLAIELAATRMKVLPPQALLARLDQRLSLLTGGARDLPSRQHTMRAAIAWSEELLNQQAQLLFRRLAVFAGGCTLEAVDAVCLVPPLTLVSGGEQPIDALDGVAALVEANLIFQEEGPGGEPRFRMLETVRDYALERLQASEDLANTRRQHAHFFLALAEEAEPHLNSGLRKEWLERLDADHDNLREALEWSASAAEGDTGLRLVGALVWFWFHLGYLREGRARLERVLVQSGTAAPPLARGKALAGLGGICLVQGDYAEAQGWLEQSVALLRDGEDAHVLSGALAMLGLTLMSQGEPLAAQAPVQESIERSRQAGDKWGEAFALSVSGSVALLSGEYATSRARLEESLGLFQEQDDAWGRVMVLADLANLTQATGDELGARGLYAEAIALCRDLRDKWWLARTLIGAAEVELALGDHERARGLYKESLPLARDLGYAGGVLLSLAGMAAVANAQNQPERAGELFAAADTHLTSSASSDVTSRLELDRLVADTRAHVDPVTFAKGWEVGQSMTLEQAIASAFELASSADSIQSAR
jgi:predicted ATPase